MKNYVPVRDKQQLYLFFFILVPSLFSLKKKYLFVCSFSFFFFSFFFFLSFFLKLYLLIVSIYLQAVETETVSVQDLQNEVKELRILVTTLMEEKSTKVREMRTSPAQKLLKGKRSELVSTTNEYAGIYTCISMLRFGSSISIYSKEILSVISFLFTFATHSSLGRDVFVLCHTFQSGS